MEKKNITGAKKRHPLRGPRRFRLSFINENTFNEVWTLKFSGVKIIGAIALLIFAIGCMVATLIVFTPIRTLLPGYLKENQRQENIVTMLKVDSLAEVVNVNNAFMSNVIDLLGPDSDTTAGTTKHQELSTLPADSLLPASENEKKFLHQFEDAERFNLSVLSPAAAEGVAFFSPVDKSMVKETGGNAATSITFITPKDTPVKSIYTGTVATIYSVLGQGNSVVVQHPNGFISIYSGISSLFVKQGDKVETGSALGIAGAGDNPDGREIKIEIWNNGSALNPRDYIPF